MAAAAIQTIPEYQFIAHSDSQDRRYRVTAWRGGCRHLHTLEDRRRERRRIDAVLAAVSDLADVSLADLLGASRASTVVEARLVLIGVLRKMDFSTLVVSRIAQRDRTSLVARPRTGHLAADPGGEQERTTRIEATIEMAYGDVQIAMTPTVDVQAAVDDGIDADLYVPDLGVVRAELDADLGNLHPRVRDDVKVYLCDVLLRSRARHDAVSAARGLWVIASTPWVREAVFEMLGRHRCARLEGLIQSHARRVGWS